MAFPAIDSDLVSVETKLRYMMINFFQDKKVSMYNRKPDFLEGYKNQYHVVTIKVFYQIFLSLRKTVKIPIMKMQFSHHSKNQGILCQFGLVGQA